MLVLAHAGIEGATLTLGAQHCLLQINLHLLKLLPEISNRQDLLLALDMLEEGRQSAELSVLLAAIELVDSVEVVGVQ